MCQTKQVRYLCRHVGPDYCWESCNYGYNFSTKSCKANKNKRIGFYDEARVCQKCRQMNEKATRRKPAPRTKFPPQKPPPPPGKPLPPIPTPAARRKYRPVSRDCDGNFRIQYPPPGPTLVRRPSSAFRTAPAKRTETQCVGNGRKSTAGSSAPARPGPKSRPAQKSGKEDSGCCVVM